MSIARRGLLWTLIGLSWLAPAVGAVTNRLIYATGFEVSEGYDARWTLVGQEQWTAFGSGGNGVVTNFFEGNAQQAYIGFFAPAPKDDALTVLRPLNVAPIPAESPVIRFSVRMQIVNSGNGQYDHFRWSVYNTNGQRLISLNFDNSSLDISYYLDGTNAIPTGLKFDNDGVYDVVMTMDFARNIWDASLNDVPVVAGEPLTTRDLALNLGDIDAVWVLLKPGQPGDNYMVFDDYRVEAAPGEPPTFRLQTSGLAADGRFLLRVLGDPGRGFVLEDSLELEQWLPLLTNTLPREGFADFDDADVRFLDRRFYRVRAVGL